MIQYFNRAMKAPQKRCESIEDTINLQRSYLSTLIARKNKYKHLSDSLRKIGHFNKKGFNSSTIVSCQASPRNPKQNFPDRPQPHLTRYVSQRPLTFKRLSQETTSDRKHRFQTQYISKEKSHDCNPDQKQWLMSTACSQHDCEQSQLTKIDEFKLITMIGRGKFGSVFLAIHRLTGFVGAMKVIEKSDIEKLPNQCQQKMKEQLLNEIKIQATLNHPNLIKLYDFFYDQNRIYMFMELGTDGHLFDALRESKTFSEETTSIVTREIVQGVKHMHSKGIIHRDVKMENIVFTYGMAKICDFGWSVYDPKDNFRSTLCGTPLYLSPQILKGQKYNKKIDIWAIGTLSHEMATGKNPFGIRRQEELSKIVKQNFEMREGSPELRSFITFILRKQPQERPTADILLRHPFIEKYWEIETAEELC